MESLLLNRRRTLAAVAAATLTSSVLFAQSNPPGGGASNGAATGDDQWNEITTLLTPLQPSWPAGSPTAAEQEGFLRQQAGRFMLAADKAGSFASANPAHAKAGEARGAEAKALLQAAMAGNSTRAERASGLVSSLRRDDRLTAKARLELVALADIVRLRPLGRDRDRFMAAHEEALRNLIAEFPGEAGGYERLLRLAENHYDDAAAVRIARDVAQMTAPAGIREAAGVILDRHALAGQSLRTIALAALGESNPISAAQNRGIILYTWSSAAPGSFAISKDLARMAPTGALLVGVNVDADTTAAVAVAQAEKLPGEQLYDARGFESSLAQALKLRRVGEVYVADRSGIIRSVSGRRGDLTAKLGWAGR